MFFSDCIAHLYVLLLYLYLQVVLISHPFRKWVKCFVAVRHSPNFHEIASLHVSLCAAAAHLYFRFFFFSSLPHLLMFGPEVWTIQKSFHTADKQKHGDPDKDNLFWLDQILVLWSRSCPKVSLTVFEPTSSSFIKKNKGPKKDEGHYFSWHGPRKMTIKVCVTDTVCKYRGSPHIFGHWLETAAQWPESPDFSVVVRKTIYREWRHVISCN